MVEQIETFWACGKNHAASRNRNGRSMRECMSHLRDGWYGNDQYFRWDALGRPQGKGPMGSGPELAEASRLYHARRRTGNKDATVADWVPQDCCPPVSCAGLIRKAQREAEEMIASIPGLSGTLAALEVEDGAKLVDDHTRNFSDLTGVSKEHLVGDDVVEDGTAGDNPVPDDEDLPPARLDDV